MLGSLLVLVPSLIYARHQNLLSVDLHQQELEISDEVHTMKRYQNLLGIKASHAGPLLGSNIYNIGRRVYYGNMWFGSQATAVITIFDTGSSDNWVASGNCSVGNMCSADRNRNYNASASSDYVPNGEPFEILYGSGGVKGYLTQDTAYLANTKIANLTFAEVQTADPGIANSPIGAILGLAWPELSTLYPTYPMTLDRFWEAQPSLQHIVSFHLKDRDDLISSRIYFGGVNETEFTGPIQYFPADVLPFWGVELGTITYFDHEIYSNGQKALVDTGTTLIYMPFEVFKDINAYIGARGSNYTVPCSRLTNLASIFIGIGPDSVPFELRPDQYIYQDANGVCKSGLRGNPQGATPLWILGTVFLRAYYSVFDFENSRIGFAPSLP